MKNLRTLGVAAIALSAVLSARPSWSDDILTTYQFKDVGSVAEWRAAAANVVYVKNVKDEWYRADMVESCMTLNTAAGVKFLTESDMEDPRIKVSRVVVDHHMCTVYKLEKADGPPATTFTPPVVKAAK